MDKKSLLLAGLLIVAFVAFMWLSRASHQDGQLQTVTVYSRNNKSLSLFREWKEAAHGQSATVNNKAFLFPEELSAFDGIMIASPRRVITDKEAKVLAAYVRRGGRLIVSAHDKDTYTNLHSLLQELDIHDTVKDDADFQNQQITAVSPPDGAEIFAPGKHYGFYSLIQFSTILCEDSARVHAGRSPPPVYTSQTQQTQPHQAANNLRYAVLDCFAQEITIDQGKILLTLGFPLPGNAMISHLNNLDFTLSLGHWAPRLLIDEYHHFFTQKTWKDLLARADVAVPLGGMMTGLVLFFLLGHSRFHERALQAPLSRAYHDLNENIVRKFLRDPTMAGEALDTQHQFLLRLFPEHVDELNARYQQAKQQISRNPSALSRVMGDFTRFHQEQLIRRGIRGNT